VLSTVTFLCARLQSEHLGVGCSGSRKKRIIKRSISDSPPAFVTSDPLSPASAISPVMPPASALASPAENKIDCET
jgi:hypothetical protein